MFVNPPQNSTIELLYGEGTELTAFHLDVNYSNDEFLAFTDEWPLEKVEQTARENARRANRPELVEMDRIAKLSQLLSPVSVTNFILENNNDKNIVFDIKMNILQSNPDVDKEGKRKLRRSKTITGIFSVYNEYYI